MTAGDTSPTWRRAVKSDQAQIDLFVCTDPEKPQRSKDTRWQPRHPRLWEYDAQQMIRSLRVPARGQTETWVLVDAEGVAGVCSWSLLDEPGYVHLDVAGVAIRHRRAGSRLGELLVRSALSEIEAWAIQAGAREMYVDCEIYGLNDKSLRLARAFGMTLVEEAGTGAQTWALRYPLRGED